jgi:nitrous oxide reductase accessory protein NosL
MNNKREILGVFLTGCLLLLPSCFRGDATGPDRNIHWDREVCERCKMAVSDHFYSAQVRGGAEGQHTKLYYFDDLGCAVIWLDEQPWKNDSRTEVWVNDFQTEEWIDATKAVYVKGKITPMDFGLGATVKSSAPVINYEQAVAHIYQVRNRKMANKKKLHTALPGSTTMEESSEPVPENHEPETSGEGNE